MSITSTRSTRPMEGPNIKLENPSHPAGDQPETPGAPWVAPTRAVQGSREVSRNRPPSVPPPSTSQGERFRKDRELESQIIVGQERT